MHAAPLTAVRDLSAVMGLSLLLGCSLLGESLPSATEPQSDTGADELARQFEAGINKRAWDNTGALRWSFRGEQHHLWDKKRGLIQVQWEEYRVQRYQDQPDSRGRVWEDGVDVTDADNRTALIASAYSKWANDSFWLNPLAKLFDDGVQRQLARNADGQHGLLVTYGSGGVTPGDSYFWVPETLQDGAVLPKYWQMWVSIIPVGGVQFTWENWQQLSTGALIAPHHVGRLIDIDLSAVDGAATVEEWYDGADPFAPLLSLE